MRIEVEQARDFRAVSEFAVRLVGDEVNGRALFGALFVQERGERLQLRPPVHRARGVVGRIENDGFGPRADRTIERGEVEMEVRRRLCLDDLPARPFDKDAVLREVGRNDDELVPRLGHGGKRNRERRRRAARHVDARRGHGCAERRLKILRDRRAHLGRARRGSIAVEPHRGRFRDETDDLRIDFGRRRNAGIPEREIEHLVRADLLFARIAVFKNFADDRAFLAQPPHGLVDTHNRYFL